MYIILYGKESDPNINVNVSYTGDLETLKRIVKTHLESFGNEYTKPIYYHLMIMRNGHPILIKNKKSDKYLSLGVNIEPIFVKSIGIEELIENFRSDQQLSLSLIEQFLTIKSDTRDFTLMKALNSQNTQNRAELALKMQNDPIWINILNKLGSFGKILRLKDPSTWGTIIVDYPV